MSSNSISGRKLTQPGRERKRNEDLASKIFSSKRRQSAPGKLKPTATAGGSLASRVGVKKTIPNPGGRPLSSKRRASVPAGNINGEWTHDLHDTTSLGSRISRGPLPKASSNAVASAHGAPASLSRKQAKQAKLAAALANPSSNAQVNIIQPKSQPGLTIRGLAGPYAVLGQNFAPGTTPADVESAMTPIGGEMVSCSVVKTQPFLMMEMVFVSREGGQRVIETFNNKTVRRCITTARTKLPTRQSASICKANFFSYPSQADGRVLKVFPKPGSGLQASNPPRANRGHVVDGKNGFTENGFIIDKTGSGKRKTKR